MADTKHHDTHSSHGTAFDAEIDIKTIVWSGVILTLVTLVALLLMWGMGVIFKEAEQAKDPAPSPMAEALLDPIPPGPRLQSSPPRDMDEMRAQDHAALTTYGWVDPSAGVAHVPIDRAMTIVLEKGLGAAADKKEAK
jgi:hypothetical protein